MRTEATVKIVIEMTGEEFEKLREENEQQWRLLKNLIVKKTGNPIVDFNFTI